MPVTGIATALAAEVRGDALAGGLRGEVPGRDVDDGQRAHPDAGGVDRVVRPEAP